MRHVDTHMTSRVYRRSNLLEVRESLRPFNGRRHFCQAEGVREWGQKAQGADSE